MVTEPDADLSQQRFHAATARARSSGRCNPIHFSSRHSAHRRRDLVRASLTADAIAAGIMLRDSAAADALMTMCSSSAATGGLSQPAGAKYRNEFHTEGDWHNVRNEAALPRETRRAAASGERLPRLDNARPGTVLSKPAGDDQRSAGRPVRDGRDGAAKTAAFDRVQLTRRDPENSTARRRRTASCLANGSVIRGRSEIREHTSVSFPSGRDFAVATLHVARILFQDFTGQRATRPCPRSRPAAVCATIFWTPNSGAWVGEIKMNSSSSG